MLVNFCTGLKSLEPDNRNTYKTNINPKKNIGQRRQNFSLEYFDALFYHHFQPNEI